MSTDYSSSVIWISQKTSLALRASHEQDSLARLQNPVAPGYRTRLSLHAAVTHYFLVNFDIQLLRSLISFCGSNIIFKVGNHCVIIGTLIRQIRQFTLFTLALLQDLTVKNVPKDILEIQKMDASVQVWSKTFWLSFNLLLLLHSLAIR